ncbi:hypothetical protein [Streptomyces griseorubiginosus]|uniref:hypothetical protein n=1 Tax=Streptomyces griseorubiginosus TaxID=67304 RepID=UPI002E811BED|nr:hypothetical protein [Streptomyces griseorubiginosus]WUB44615.1 hypothetical protein OHN19_15205 [Streptomyces griseorubiginosus]WUB53132.1 hypothetical protein OG942_15200 [Streptomyces griseorubiginosus]
MGYKAVSAFSPSPLKTWSLLTAVVLTLMVASCSRGSGNEDPAKAEKLCDGAVDSSARAALAKVTGTSTVSSTLGSASYTPQELRSRALEWGADGDPWKSNTERWFCSVGDRDGEKTLGIGSSWSLVSFTQASAEVDKGSRKYLRISPDTIIQRGGSGRVDVYFPCRIISEGKAGETYTLEVDLSTDISDAVDAQAEVNKVVLSVARWMSSKVGCANTPDIPTSAT